MNIISILKKTDKWIEFEIWYEEWRKSHSKNFHTFNIAVFEQYCFDIQTGVFQKYLESIGFNVEKQLNDIIYDDRCRMTEAEILDKRYTESWYLRTVSIFYDEYITICLNPTDWLGNSVPFDSFEDLLTWVFEGQYKK